MIEHFIRHIRQKNLLDFEKTYFIAISGGMDSVVLSYLMHLSKIKFILAHCNFRLRGEESDGDEAFVREWGQKLGVEVVVGYFDTDDYAKNNGVSTQMAARDLRYQWFDDLIAERKLAGVVVAHHLDDQVETVLLNLMRGTGIEGIYGMADKREKIIRPLLDFSKTQIQTYALSVPLSWREDSSNAKDVYKRNHLRNKILPLIRKHDENAIALMEMSFDRIKDTGRAFFYFLQEWLDRHLEIRGNYQMLPLDQLKSVPGYKSLIYYWLKDYGFNYFQTEDIARSIAKNTVGKLFYGSLGEANIDRYQLILKTGKESDTALFLEGTEENFICGGQIFSMTTAFSVQIDKSPQNAMLDMDNLTFPLMIRKWEEGDRFIPLGMKNFKKVSDFLIDLKIPLIHKQNVKVLCSGGNIAWIIGLRVDDRFKITSKTKTVLHIKRQN
ncbi:tRNA lysidine(34) synthetase TilS [Anditalea andensis]|uniref:tRNA(Ile)-lysidine synthase n=1 Tax=Anditalea andensis TaxID=1048983 RepID=A0A074L511_9BACT|nr:tRNA lysidine(34) synthetase TilS [Anditalea andensis]KEO74933.1 tRNA(Ile)-lysidine synthetase [Anditalea andensis]